MSIRIMIADDHKLFRSLILTHLKMSSNISIVGEAENGEHLLRMMATTETDVVLLDLNMPKMNGLEALTEIRKRYKSVKVIILSMHDAESYIVQSIEAGASGYVHKNAEVEEIEVAIDSVMKEGFYFNEKTNKALLARIIKRKNLNPVFDSNNLSFNNTELKVLKYLCQECTSNEIAQKVYISPRSVEGVRQRLIKKANVKNVVGLALFALKNGLLDT